MRILNVVIGIIMILASACQSQSSSNDSSGDNSTIDLTAYTVENIQGSDLKYVYRMENQEFIIEEGYVRNGQKTGTWIQYHPQTYIPQTISTYANGLLTGTKIEVDQRGQITSTQGLRGEVPHGVKATFKYGKTMEIAPYKDGKLHGKYKKYFDGRDRGKIQQHIEYADGKLHGLYIHYNAEGDKVLEYEYSNGEKISGGIIKSGN